MVKELKAASRTTQKTVTTVYDVIVLTAKAAAGVKLATDPYVHSKAGNLPVWQIVAALLLASVAYRLIDLHKKEN